MLWGVYVDCGSVRPIKEGRTARLRIFGHIILFIKPFLSSESTVCDGTESAHFSCLPVVILILSCPPLLFETVTDGGKQGTEIKSVEVN